MRDALTRLEKSVNLLHHVKLRLAGGRSGARRGRLIALAQQLPHRVEPLRVGPLRIRIAQSALDALLQGAEILDDQRAAAPLVGSPVPVNQYIDGLQGEPARGEIPGDPEIGDPELFEHAGLGDEQRRIELPGEFVGEEGAFDVEVVVPATTGWGTQRRERGRARCCPRWW